MYIITIDEATCKGCSDCVENCPAGILSLNGEGKAQITGDIAECAGCESCTAVCETGSITLQEV